VLLSGVVVPLAKKSKKTTSKGIRQPGLLTGKNGPSLVIPVLSMLLVMALVVGLFISQIKPEASVERLQEGIRYSVPKPFVLPKVYTLNGRLLSLADFKGKWTLINFGYLSCPDICPINMAEIHKVVSKMSRRGHPIQVMYVTMDPVRDNAEILKGYLNYFDSEYLGVAGEIGELQAFGRALGIFFSLDQPDLNGNYAVTHNSVLSAINPDGLLAGQLSGIFDHTRLKTFLDNIMG
jgi:protein SCO1